MRTPLGGVTIVLMVVSVIHKQRLIVHGENVGKVRNQLCQSPSIVGIESSRQTLLCQLLFTLGRRHQQVAKIRQSDNERGKRFSGPLDLIEFAGNKVAFPVRHVFPQGCLY